MMEEKERDGKKRERERQKDECHPHGLKPISIASCEDDFSKLQVGDVMNARFFDSNIRGFGFHLL